MPVGPPRQPRSWLSEKDIIAINAISAGALCPLSAGFACPSSMDKEISARVQTAADIAQLPFLIKSLIKAGLSIGAIAIILRKDPDDVAKIATKVAGNFDNLQCLECAEAIIKELGKAGYKGTFR